jgi:hypothetical protein
VDLSAPYLLYGYVGPSITDRVQRVRGSIKLCIQNEQLLDIAHHWNITYTYTRQPSMGLMYPPPTMSRKRTMESPHRWGNPTQLKRRRVPEALSLSGDCDDCQAKRGTQANISARHTVTSRRVLSSDDDDHNNSRTNGPTIASSRMRAAHTPAISTKGWTFESVLQHGERFRPIERIKATASEADIQKAIRRYEDEGIPMIIEGWHKHEQWPKDMFSLDFFKKHCGTGMFWPCSCSVPL